MNEKTTPIVAPPMANGFGAFGRGGNAVGGVDRQPYLDVDAFLQRLNPLSFLSSLFSGSSRRSPRRGKPARSTSYLSQPEVQRYVKASPILKTLTQPQPPIPPVGGG